MRLLQRLATPIQVLITFGLYVQLALLYGVSAWPSVFLFRTLWRVSAGWQEPLRVLALAVSLFAAFFLFVLVLPIVVGVYRIVTRAGSPVGRHPYYSLKGLSWASYNSLILAVRYTVMDFMRVTPFLPFFHRLMGMKCGARVQINTKVIADSNLITVGDDTVIGGDVTLVCHAAEAGDLVCAPVKIGSRVTLGLMAVILPGCEIGDGAFIAANAVLSKGTQVPPHTIWGGIPARQIGSRLKGAPVEAP